MPVFMDVRRTCDKKGLKITASNKKIKSCTNVTLSTILNGPPYKIHDRCISCLSAEFQRNPFTFPWRIRLPAISRNLSPAWWRRPRNSDITFYLLQLSVAKLAGCARIPNDFHRRYDRTLRIRGARVYAKQTRQAKAACSTLLLV